MFSVTTSFTAVFFATLPNPPPSYPRADVEDTNGRPSGADPARGHRRRRHSAGPDGARRGGAAGAAGLDPRLRGATAGGGVPAERNGGRPAVWNSVGVSAGDGLPGARGDGGGAVWFDPGLRAAGAGDRGDARGDGGGERGAGRPLAL